MISLTDLEYILIIISAILIILLFSSFIIFIFWFRSSIDSKIIPIFKDLVKPTYAIDQPSISSKEDILTSDCIDDNKLISFYYIDDQMVKDLYSQKEQCLPTNQTEKMSVSKKEGIAAGIKPGVADIKSSFEDTANMATETKKSYILSSSFCCREIMKHMHLSDKIYKSNLERQIYNPKIIDTFDECCETLHNDCYITFSEYWKNGHREILKKYMSSEILKMQITDKYQNIDYILLRADFNFEKDNNLLKKIIADNDIIFEIPFDISKTSVKDIFNTGRKINITVLGKMNWNLELSTMTIIPIAIY
jgi:hypothetical protein